MYLTNHLLSAVLWSNAHLIVNFLLEHMYHSTTTVPLYHHCTRRSWDVASLRQMIIVTIS